MSFEDSLIRFASAEEAAAFAADRIADTCRQAVAQRGIFHWVLAGGSTPAQCYRLLSRHDLPWARVHCWFGDERALPDGHPERNESMARQALLDHVPIPAAQIHAIDFSNGTEQAARAYDAQLRQMHDPFDLILLGMGEDGHTASLFPDHPGLQSTAMAVAVYQSPKPPSERVSMTLQALNRHRQCLLLATGANKAAALQDIARGIPLPASRIHHAQWIVDQAAWP